MDTGTKSSDHSFDLSIGINLIQSCLLNIQNFSTKRKNCLCSTASCSFGTASRRISLNDINFTVGRILIRTVSQLSGKTHTLQRCFSPCKISCLSGCISCSLSQNGFFTDQLGNCWILLKEISKLFADNIINSTSCLCISKLLFGLSFKLRILDLDTYNSCQTFSDIITGKIGFTFLQKLIISCIIIKGFGQGIPETYQMGTTLRCIDVIYKTVGTLCVGIIVLHGHFHINTILCSFKIQNILIKSCFTSVQVSNKFLDSTFIMEFPDNRIFSFFHTKICQNDLKSLGKECHFTESLFQNIKFINSSFLENSGIRLKAYLGSCLICRTFTIHFQWITYMSSLISLFVNLSALINFYLKPVGKCIYNRSTYTMKSTGNLVSSTAEFSTGMQDRKYNFHSRKS